MHEELSALAEGRHVPEDRAVPVRCVIADPRPATVDYLRVYLGSEGIRIVGTSNRGDQALARIEAEQPDVAVVNLRIPALDGIEVARACARVSPATAVIVHAGHADRAAVFAAFEVGARGCVWTGAQPAQYRRAVEAVAAGELFLDPQLTEHGPRRSARITRRELDVLRLVAEGYSDTDVAHRLAISTSTVRIHLASARTKLKAANRAHAVAAAHRLHLLP